MGTLLENTICVLSTMQVEVKLMRSFFVHSVPQLINILSQNLDLLQVQK